MILIALVVVFCATSCFANSQLAPYNETALILFLVNDENGDGIMSHTELVKSFDHYDADFNGVISKEEYTRYETHTDPALYDIVNGLYELFDVNKDDILTEVDFEALYRIWDANEDNVVSQVEFIHWWKITLETLDKIHNPNGV